MREFIYGTKEQFDSWRASIDREGSWYFYNCSLPACCNQNTCCIGAYKDEYGFYCLYIDQGINCNNNSSPRFNEWIREGVLRFMDFPDIAVFFNSLSVLYR